MTPKQEQEKIKELEKELQKVTEQRDGLAKRVAELEKARPASKSRQQAEQGLEMLKSGPVTREQFAKLNPKYPSDVPYYIRTLLKVDVKTVRIQGKGTCYMTPEQFAIYSEGLRKEKLAAEAAAKDAKEEIPQAKASVSTQAVAA